MDKINADKNTVKHIRTLKLPSFSFTFFTARWHSPRKTFVIAIKFAESRLKIAKFCYLYPKKSIHALFCYGLFQLFSQNLVKRCPQGVVNSSRKATKQENL